MRTENNNWLSFFVISFFLIRQNANSRKRFSLRFFSSLIMASPFPPLPYPFSSSTSVSSRCPPSNHRSHPFVSNGEWRQIGVLICPQCNQIEFPSCSVHRQLMVMKETTGSRRKQETNKQNSKETPKD